MGGKLEDEGNELAKREEDTEETPWAKAVSAVWEVGAVLKEPAATEAHGTRKEKHRSQNSQMRGEHQKGCTWARAPQVPGCASGNLSSAETPGGPSQVRFGGGRQWRAKAPPRTAWPRLPTPLSGRRDGLRP